MKLSKSLVAAALLLLACKSFAQTTTDLGSWCSLQLIKPLDKAYAMARLEHRSYDNISATECWFGMAGGGYSFTKWLKADLSYEFWKMPAAGDITKQKIVACATGTLKRESLAVSIREKYELAFTDGADGPSNTLRTRLRTQYAVPSTAFTPYVMYELFYGLGGIKWIRSLHYAGTEIKIADGHSLDFFYMYNLYPSAATLKACNVLGAGYIICL